MNKFDPITLGILWDRLISIAEEVNTALVRSSFSTIVREGCDCQVVLFDSKGSTLAQPSLYSVPSFCGTAPATIRHMLRKFPPDTLQPGDVVMTNDPWLGTGHLFDINVMRPAFRGGQLVGGTISVTHLPDIGGKGWSATGSEVYEEGLQLPICKLVSAGKLNEELLKIIRANVRVSESVIGDLMANVTCNEVGERLLIEFMDEYGIDDLVPLSKAIIGKSEKVMREKIKEMPDGVYENKIKVDATQEEVATLACKLKIAGDSIHVDFDGTSPALRAGVNVPLCYTKAFTFYAIKCLTIPTVPNNEGSLNPITFSAPEGCILNPQWPSATGGRHTVGHFVNSLIFEALAKVVPELVQADSGMYSTTNFQGTHRNGSGVSSVFFTSGGFGAIDGVDGASVVPGPSVIQGIPVEVWEDVTSTTVEKKALLPDSGGAGKYRGGLGQEIVIRNDTEHLMTVHTFGPRTKFPTMGMNGGKSGKLRRYLINGKQIDPKGKHVFSPGDEIKIFEAGGGGHGDPRERPVEKVLKDVENGFVTVEGALRDYGVKVDVENLTAERV